MKRFYSIEEMLENDTRDWKLSFNKEETTTTIATSDTVKHFMRRFYGDRLYSEHEVNVSDAHSDFWVDWSMFLSRNNESIARIYQAMTEEYNPIENYDRHESITVTHTGDDTTTYSGTEQNTKSGSIDNEKTGSETSANGTGNDAITTSNYVTGYNQSDESLESKSVTTGKTTLSFNARKDKQTYNSLSDTKTFTGRNDKVEYNTEDTTTAHLHGNIGVTTNTEMIERELELRSMNVCDIVLKKFIDEVTFYL